jgi:hypothetical protein
LAAVLVGCGVQVASSDDAISACLTRNALVEREIEAVGDNVMYRLFERNGQARQQCEEGQVDTAYSRMAEIRFDVRVLWGERQLD